MARYDGKTTRRKLKKLQIGEISIVDMPAHTPAQVAILKRAAQAEKRVAMTDAVDGHVHVLQTGDQQSGMTDWAGEDDHHTHPWIIDEQGTLTIGEANGHTHQVAVVVTKEQAQGFAAALDSHTDKAETPPAEGSDPGPNTSQDHSMTEKQNDADQANQLAELTKKNERLSAVVSLTPEQRAHFDTLKGEAQDEFLAAEDKDAIVKNAADADPVVYKTLSGRELRKSAGPDVIEMAKELDAEKRENLANREVAKRNALLKRAGDELGHLTGADEAKADLLGAVETLPTEKREAVLAILKSKDAGMEKAFSEVGTSDSGNGSGADANSRIEGIAKRIQEADPKLTAAQAYVKALETPEGQQLHAELIGR